MAVGRTTGSNGAGPGKKPSGPVKTYTMNAETMAFVKKKAETSSYFASLLEGYNQYGSLTEKQMAAVEKEAKRDEDYKKRPQLKDADGVAGPINNRIFRDDKPVCFLKGCKDLAKVRVGTIGVCNDHTEEAAEMNEQYALEHART